MTCSARHLASLANYETLFETKAGEKLARLREELAPLSARYDVVVANPPYMGSSSMGRWLAAWVKKNYKDAYRDLCTCFVQRGFSLCDDHGASAMVTMQSWMFLGSFERMRKSILENHAILAMAHLGTRAFGAIAGEVVSTTATVFSSARQGAPGAYVRLVDYGSEAEKRERLLEALADPGCGWFYRRDASAFEAIPGSPIAYWASDSLSRNCTHGVSVDVISSFTGSQNITANNALYIRFIWEVNLDSCFEGKRWIPYAKGGEFRRWYGNIDTVVDWSDKATEHYKRNSTSNLLCKQLWFQEGITYTDITSGRAHFRYLPKDCVFDKTGPSIVFLGSNLRLALGTFNSSVAQYYFNVFNPTIHLQTKDVKAMPLMLEVELEDNVNSLVENCISLSRGDWNSREISYAFARSPLI